MRKKMTKADKDRPRRELAKRREEVRKRAKKRRTRKHKTIQFELGGIKKMMTPMRIQRKREVRKVGKKFCLCFFMFSWMIKDSGSAFSKAYLSSFSRTSLI